MFQPENILFLFHDRDLVRVVAAWPAVARSEVETDSADPWEAVEPDLALWSVLAAVPLAHLEEMYFRARSFGLIEPDGTWPPEVRAFLFDKVKKFSKSE